MSVQNALHLREVRGFELLKIGRLLKEEGRSGRQTPYDSLAVLAYRVENIASQGLKCFALFDDFNTLYGFTLLAPEKRVLFLTDAHAFANFPQDIDFYEFILIFIYDLEFMRPAVRVDENAKAVEPLLKQAVKQVWAN
jgi:hypothetical protein